MRKLARDRHRVIHERAAQKLTFGVVDQVLLQHAAEPLHQRAVGLPVQGVRVDDAAHVLDRHVVDDLDAPGVRIDGDVRCVRAVAVRALVAGISALLRQRRQISQPDGLAVCRGFAVDDIDVVWTATKAPCRLIPNAPE